MISFLSNEAVNKGRQHELDLAKGIAIILMVFCHVGIYFFPEGTKYNILSGLAGDEFAAPVFMVCLGIGTVYARKNTPKDLAKRGLITLLFGYILNFVREGVPILTGLLINHPYSIRNMLWATMMIDIMQFAGLAFLVIALFKKIKLGPIQQFMIGILAAGAGEILAWQSTGVDVLDNILGLIWGTCSNSYFPLLNWIIFPLAGQLFGEILLRCNDKGELYKKIFFIGLIGVALSYYQIFTDEGYYNNASYYFMGIKNVVYALCYPILLFSVCYFISIKTKLATIPVVGFCSKYLNCIYCVSWVLILWSRYIVYDVLGSSFSNVFINFYMIIMLVVSYLIVKIYVYFKKLIKNKHQKPTLVS